MPTEVATESVATWDEAQCIAALTQFEQLQAQIDDLRLAIPRIIDPLHRPPSPSTFKLYAQGALSSQNAVKSLYETWKDPGIQSIFEHTGKSYAENGDLSASRSIPSHGWIEREKKERESKKSSRSDSADSGIATLTDKDITRIAEEFRKTYPSIILDVQAEIDTISTQFVSQAIKLKFRVTVERDSNGKHKLNAECLGAAEPAPSITRCLGSRSQPNDLKYLLDMIAAYKTVKGTSCDKCVKLLDNTMMTPTARRTKQADTNQPPAITWVALHESCLG
ncbi:hypothetical protein EK21DRAFT_76811 [Setomelanomma holmii]|uniref:Uncharacterized protein n=1 Tax=Setomelanomma holmii TaxID=210430 RepID=A0A9P4LIN2_9PLEO|nr:hypothetical protein EK21DRAFT_76811 [Setomelanomma holmii]